MRQGTRTVLCLDTQVRVFSWGMTHKCCPKHKGGAGECACSCMSTCVCMQRCMMCVLVLTTTASCCNTDYTFSTWDVPFLQLHFTPALFDALPWVMLTDKLTVGRDLADAILAQRTYGIAFELFARLRNETVARRCDAKQQDSVASYPPLCSLLLCLSLLPPHLQGCPPPAHLPHNAEHAT